MSCQREIQSVHGESLRHLRLAIGTCHSIDSCGLNALVGIRLLHSLVCREYCSACIVGATSRKLCANALVCLLSASNPNVNDLRQPSETVWRTAQKHEIPAIAFVNKLDREGADFAHVIRSLERRLGLVPLPLQVSTPISRRYRRTPVYVGAQR